MTCSLALRTLRLRAPRYPSARSRILQRCFLLRTDRLTLAIVEPPCRTTDERTAGCQRPRRRSTRALSPPTTSAGRPSDRLRRLDFFSRRCDRFCLRRRIFPVPVTLNRLAAPRWVFIFGITLLRCSEVVRDWLVPGW